MSDDQEDPKIPFISSNFFVCEITPPKAWKGDSPFSSDEFVLLDYSFQEESGYHRSVPLNFCDETGVRSTNKAYQRETRRWSAERLSQSRRKRRDEKRIKDEKFAKKQAHNRESFRQLCSNRERQAIGKKIGFLLAQCCFLRKQIHLIQGFDEECTSQENQLRQYQQELLTLRKQKKAA